MFDYEHGKAADNIQAQNCARLAVLDNQLVRRDGEVTSGVENRLRSSRPLSTSLSSARRSPMDLPRFMKYPAHL